MLPNVTFDNLKAMPLKDFLLISASPVFFTSFGFHVVIPSINKYLNGDIKRLRIAILIGTGIPLLAYALWQMAIHGAFAQTEFVRIVRANPTLGGIVEATHQATGSTLISRAVAAFSILALITSFLGVSLSLFDSFDDLVKRVNIRTKRLKIG